MIRRSIFEILSENFDVAHEIRIIWHLFSNAKITYVDENIFNGTIKYSILYCVDRFTFHNWKSRNRFISPFEMMEYFNFNNNKIEMITCFCNELLDVLEFISNMIKRCDVAIENNDIKVSKEYEMLIGNIREVLEHFGHTVFYDEDKELITIIEKNEAAISASEISTPDIAKKIIQYNHYGSKGNIDLKRNTILALASELEPQRNHLKKLNEHLASNIFSMLNNMNIRHNNIDPTSNLFRPFVAKINEDELEYWYDEIYQMILLAKLLLDNDERQKKIEKIKDNINGKI